MVELALGLQASSKPLIWAIGGKEKSGRLEKWILESRFEERNKEKWFVIRGWAPQLLILSHCTIGGFLTHCGWNSTLEGISAGVPVVSWPLFAEQFCNEKLVVEVLRIGVSVALEVPVTWEEEEKVGVLVKRDDIVKAIESVMEEGEEGEERRRRARELREMTCRAIEGGSSYANMTLLIEDVLAKFNCRESS